eukprot:UN05204
MMESPIKYYISSVNYGKPEPTYKFNNSNKLPVAVGYDYRGTLIAPIDYNKRQKRSVTLDIPERKRKKNEKRESISALYRKTILYL